MALLLTAMGAVMVTTARMETQTWDEGIHIAAGYAYWTHGDFVWNHEHPPLVKLMSALPLLPLHPRLPVVQGPWDARDQIQVGIDFLYKNGIPADTLIFRARFMTIVLTLLGGLLLALWVRRHFGPLAALIALALYCADPNLIAHGRYVTTDAPMAVFFFLVCATWCDYLLSNRRRDLLLAAFVLALALVVKFSAILLAPPLIILYLARVCQRWGGIGWESKRALLTAGCLLGSLALVVGVVYWADTWRCLAGEVPKLRLAVNRNTGTGEALYQMGRKLGLPQHQFFMGLDAVATHNSSGHPSYLLGQRSETGWWYYFPVAFAVKSTTALLAMVLLLIAAGLVRWRRITFSYVALLLPAIFFFVVSSTSGINLGIRHILPVYPPLYAAAGGVLAGLASCRRWRVGVAALVLLQTAECVSIFPDYLAFFNAPSGGPANGPRYLVDSNIDWGQDVKKLVSWLEQHGTRRVWINYFGKAELKYYGIDEANLPPGSDTAAVDAIDGFAAASVTPLHGVYVPYSDLAYLRGKVPIAKVGYSIYVWDLRKNGK